MRMEMGGIMRVRCQVGQQVERVWAVAVRIEWVWVWGHLLSTIDYVLERVSLRSPLIQTNRTHLASFLLALMSVEEHDV